MPCGAVRTLRIVAISVAVAIVIAACGTGSGPTVSLGRARTGSVEWEPCGSLQCASVSVPLDYAHPLGRRITLALARRPASGSRIGVLLTNPGGPGASGVEFLQAANQVFPAAIRDAFDIVSWDPRGVGGDSPLRCLDDLDQFYGVNLEPQTPAQVAEIARVDQQFVAACKARSGDLLPFMSTASTVRDMDAIRAALGESTISYVGFSYGTFLGARYANEFPAHVRAMVLDGAVDPALLPAATTEQQAQGFDQALDAFFNHCRAQGCGFAQGGDPQRAYDDLRAQIATEPESAKVNGELRTLGPGEFDLGVASALYEGQHGWDDLAAALTGAARGSPAGLLAQSDAYTGRTTGGHYSTETPALYATSCLDGPSPTTVAGVAALASASARVAPRFGASTDWLGLPCTFWPVPPQGLPQAIRAPGAPPIVVVGTTGDPATPYAWAQALAHELRTGHLLTAVGETHASYGRGDSCVDGTVDRYLLQLTVPPPAVRCA
jgi:pimeloyl-ACP methyl ester carboxylesterase